MADYISTLDGASIDAALQDMAMHNSEAYAIGERNGQTVASGDPTYHNNARYYAQIAVSQIEPGNIGDAVRWDTDQSSLLSDVNKAQARENIAAGSVNENLLDNAWFGSGVVVNQRGLTTWTTTGMFIDRWRIQTFNGGMSLGTDGLVITGVNSSSMMRIRQHIPNAFLNQLIGRPITFSVMVNGTVYSTTGYVTAEGDNLIDGVIINVGSGNITLLVAWLNDGTLRADIRVYTPCTINAVKLEVDAYSTLGTDCPPKYAEELRKCQYYFHRLSGVANILIGATTSTTSATFVLPHDMFTNTGSITRSGTITVNGQSVTAATQTQTTAGVTITATASSLTANNGAVLTLGSGAYIDISHDI